MITLLIGSDTHRSRRRRRALIEEFRSYVPGGLLEVVDAANTSDVTLKHIFDTQSLFIGGRMICIDNALSNSDGAEVIRERIEQFSGDNDIHVLLWSEGVSAEEKKTARAIVPFCSRTERFEPLEGKDLMAWIAAEVRERGIDLAREDRDAVVSLAPDSWAMSALLDKIAVRPASERASADAQKQRTLFELGDVFFIHPRHAVALLYRLIEQGEDEFGIFGYLAGHARTLAAVKHSQESGRPLPPETKIHPFVFKKAQQAARSIPFLRLTAGITLFFEEDWRIKTGLSTPRDSLLVILGILDGPSVLFQ